MTKIYRGREPWPELEPGLGDAVAVGAGRAECRETSGGPGVSPDFEHLKQTSKHSLLLLTLWRDVCHLR